MSGKEMYQCSRCKAWVEDKDNDVYHFKSVHKAHTLLSIQMCLKCRDKVFDFILQAAQPVNAADGIPLCKCEREVVYPVRYCSWCGGRLSR